MQAFLSFAVIPLLIGGVYWLAPWVSQLTDSPLETISVTRISIPPGVKEIRGGVTDNSPSPLRLSALMPGPVVDRFIPPPVVESTRPADEVLRLKSLLVTTDKRAAVIGDELVYEGNSIKGYRVQRITDEQVVLLGPQGREVLRFDSPGLSRAPLLPPRRRADSELGTAPMLSSDELERQYRRLLDRL